VQDRLDVEVLQDEEDVHEALQAEPQRPPRRLMRRDAGVPEVRDAGPLLPGDAAVELRNKLEQLDALQTERQEELIQQHL